MKQKDPNNIQQERIRILVKVVDRNVECEEERRLKLRMNRFN